MIIPTLNMYRKSSEIHIESVSFHSVINCKHFTYTPGFVLVYNYVTHGSIARVRSHRMCTSDQRQYMYTQKHYRFNVICKHNDLQKIMFLIKSDFSNDWWKDRKFQFPPSNIFANICLTVYNTDR